MEEIAKRKGTFCWNFIGWLKMLYYIYCWVLIFIFIHKIKSNEDLVDNTGFLITFLISLIFMLSIYMFELSSFCSYWTYKLLCNINSNDSIDSINNIMEVLFKEKPEVNISCICYHYKSKTSTYIDYQGKQQTTHYYYKEISYSENQKLNIFSYLDISGKFRLRGTSKNLIILELGKEINFNDEMTLYDVENIKNDLYLKNKSRDLFIEVSVNRIIPSKKDYYLINLSNKKNPLLNKWIYFISLILMIDQFYKLYIECITSKQFFVIRKIISSRKNVLENDKYSQFLPGCTIFNEKFVPERNSICGVNNDIKPILPTEEEIEKSKIYKKYLPEYELNENEDVVNLNRYSINNLLNIKEENQKNEHNIKTNEKDNEINNNNLYNTFNQPLLPYNNDQ